MSAIASTVLVKRGTMPPGAGARSAGSDTGRAGVGSLGRRPRWPRTDRGAGKCRRAGFAAGHSRAVGATAAGSRSADSGSGAGEIAASGSGPGGCGVRVGRPL